MSEFYWRRVRRVVTCLVMLGCLYVTSPSRAVAVPLSGFTGFTEYKGVYPYVVNYAVLSPHDSFAGVLAAAYVPAPGNMGFDAGKYTYLYQIANPTIPMTSSFHITYAAFEPSGALSNPVLSTTVGAFASGNFRLDFLNGGTVVNANGNNLQSADTLGIAARTLSGPNFVNTNPKLFGGPSHPYWTFSNGSPGFTSPLLGYQSNTGPTFAFSHLQGFIYGPENQFCCFLSTFPSVPNALFSSAPEPSTVLLIGSGLLGVVAWRRTKQTRPL